MGDFSVGAGSGLLACTESLTERSFDTSLSDRGGLSRHRTRVCFEICVRTLSWGCRNSLGHNYGSSPRNPGIHLANLAMGCATLASEGPVRLRPFPFGRQAVRVAQRLFDRVGFQLIDYRPPCSEIKDAQFYRPMFSPWLSSEWSERLHAHDPRSLVPLHAKYLLYCLALDATRRCWGEVAECGVYKGGTAKILAELVSDRPLHLFDTFCGMPQPTLSGICIRLATLPTPRWSQFADTCRVTQM